MSNFVTAVAFLKNPIYSQVSNSHSQVFPIFQLPSHQTNICWPSGFHQTETPAYSAVSIWTPAVRNCAHQKSLHVKNTSFLQAFTQMSSLRLDYIVNQPIFICNISSISDLQMSHRRKHGLVICVSKYNWFGSNQRKDLQKGTGKVFNFFFLLTLTNSP